MGNLAGHVRYFYATFLICAGMLVTATVAKGAIILTADFNSSPLKNNPPTTTVTAADLNAGTNGGVWTVNSGLISQIRQESGNPSNRALAADRGSYDFGLALGTPPVFATDSVVLSFDTEVIRTLSGAANANTKKNFVTGYDSLNNEVFSIVVTTDGGTTANRGRLRYVDSSGNELNLASGLPAVNNNPADFSPANFRNVRIEFFASTMDIFVDNSLIADDAALRSVGATNLARIVFTGAGTANADINADAGAWYDNITVSAVPEPSSFVIGTVGLLGLLLRRRVRQDR